MPVFLVVGIAVVAITLAIILAIIVWQVARMTRRIEVAQETADHDGEVASADGTGKHPLLTLSRFGTISDPLNLKIVGTAEQLVATFLTAGWYRADRIRIFSSLRISVATVFKLRYSSAPVSNLYLYGRKQDFAFQKPGNHARERDHVRFWNSDEVAADGRPIWVGAATRDVNVDISLRTPLITHRIAPDVDSERATIAHDLTATGGVIGEAWDAGFGHPISMINAMGFPFHSDGCILMLTLADVPVLLPVEAGLSGPTGGRITGRFFRLFRWLLPSQGRRLAWRVQRKEEAALRTPLRDQPPIGA